MNKYKATFLDMLIRLLRFNVEICLILIFVYNVIFLRHCLVLTNKYFLLVI